MELDVSWLKLVNQSQKIPNLSGTLRISEHLAESRRDKLCFCAETILYSGLIFGRSYFLQGPDFKALQKHRGGAEQATPLRCEGWAILICTSLLQSPSGSTDCFLFPRF